MRRGLSRAPAVAAGAAYGAVFLALAAVFSLLTVAVAARTRVWQFYNSDAVQAFMLLRDALAAPADLLRWYHPPNLFVFPDWLISGALVLSPIPFTLLPLVYPGVIVAGYCLAIAWLVAETGLLRFRYTVAGAAGLFLLLLGIIATQPGWNAKQYIVLLLPPFYHTGALFAGILTAAALCRLSRGQARGWLVAVLPALAFLAGLSDTFYLAWFAFPLFVAAALQALAERRWTILHHAALILVAAIAGNLLTLLTADHYPPCGLYAATVGTLKRFVYQALVQGDLVLLAVMALMGLMALRGLVLAGRCIRRRPLSPPAFAELMLIGSTWAAIAIPAGLGCMFVEWLFRYSTPIFVFPFVWAALFVFQRIGPIWRRAGTLAATVPGAAFWIYLVPFGDFDAGMLRKSPLARCLDRPEGATGLGDYWSAKRVMLETDYRVHIVQLAPDLQPYRFNFNGRWFREHAKDGRALRPTFIVLTRLKPDLLRRTFGKPDKVERCGGEMIWRYDRPLAGFVGK